MISGRRSSEVGNNIRRVGWDGPKLALEAEAVVAGSGVSASSESGKAVGSLQAQVERPSPAMLRASAQ